MNETQGSAGNVLAALFFFVGAGIVWFISFGTLGWTIHIWACINAALWKPVRTP